MKPQLKGTIDLSPNTGTGTGQGPCVDLSPSPPPYRRGQVGGPVKNDPCQHLDQTENRDHGTWHCDDCGQVIE